MAKHRPTTIETVLTDWSDLVLVCRSCGDDGFGDKGRDALSGVLKRALRARGQRRRVGIAEVECLGVCPKHAITVGLASRPDRLLIVPEGETADLVLDRLGVAAAPAEPS